MTTSQAKFIFYPILFASLLAAIIVLWSEQPLKNEICLFLICVAFISGNIIDTKTGHMHGRFFDVDRTKSPRAFAQWMKARWILVVIFFLVAVMKVVSKLHL